MYTDEKRLQQVSRILLSERLQVHRSRASVTLKICKRLRLERRERPASASGQVLAFSVTDNGIGIQKRSSADLRGVPAGGRHHQPQVRRHRAGLSISREIARLLGANCGWSASRRGGDLHPVRAANPTPGGAPAGARDRAAIDPDLPTRTPAEPSERCWTTARDRDGDCVTLIVEDDPRFASILLAAARESGFKGVVTGEGSAVLPLIRRINPHAIMLDMGLPDMDGWALLDMLKRTPETRHIPVHVISASDQKGLGLSLGAYAFTSKPVERDEVTEALDTIKRLANEENRRLVVIGDGETLAALEPVFGSVESADSLQAAVTLSKDERPECVVLEIRGDVPEDLGDQLRQVPFAPVVIYLRGDMSAEDERRLRLAVFEGLGRLARTPEQLVEEVAMRLHEPVERLPAEAREQLIHAGPEKSMLAGRKVVIIDDDIRNIYSLTSALEEFGLDLAYAESGRAGIDLLKEDSAVDVVLVDIMMPDMDGYETIQEIRSTEGLADMPIVAVTAKAMKGDRQKCLQAGAWDYVSKPVDVDHLISVLRVCIQRADRAAALREAGENVVMLPAAS
jgi:CheY-like chemotaxis protein